jgi:hypothetical protein
MTRVMTLAANDSGVSSEATPITIASSLFEGCLGHCYRIHVTWP